MLFDNREQAGRLLAARLDRLRDAHPVVLGLTRGGIPIAFEVAQRLGAPLDLVVVRKVRAPSMPDSSVGAVAEGGITYLNPTYVHDARLGQEDVAELADEAVVELARRVRLYRGEVPAPRLHGRTVVIVDDFVVTGTTARAAARAARRRGAARIVFAVPVLAVAAEAELRGEFDEVVALEVGTPLQPLGQTYQLFEEITDEAAMDYLRRASTQRLAEEAAVPSPS